MCVLCGSECRHASKSKCGLFYCCPLITIISTIATAQSVLSIEWTFLYSFFWRSLHQLLLAIVKFTLHLSALESLSGLEWLNTSDKKNVYIYNIRAVRCCVLCIMLKSKYYNDCVSRQLIKLLAQKKKNQASIDRSVRLFNFPVWNSCEHYHHSCSLHSFLTEWEWHFDHSFLSKIRFFEKILRKKRLTCASLNTKNFFLLWYRYKCRPQHPFHGNNKEILNTNVNNLNNSSDMLDSHFLAIKRETGN